MQSEKQARRIKPGYALGGLVVTGLAAYALTDIYPSQFIWIAVIALVVLVPMLVKPPKRLQGHRLLVFSMLIVAFFTMVRAVEVSMEQDAELRAEQARELEVLKTINPTAYLDELKTQGRDKQWIAALKGIRPAEYMAEKARRDEKAKRDQARKEKQDRREQIEQFYRNAKGEGREGVNLRAADFKDTWNLSVPEGRLHCKHGPVYNGKPQPYVLFDANGKTYGVNGAAMGKGGYADARTLLAGEAGEVPYDLKMLDVLLKSGLEMCRATLAARPVNTKGLTFKLEEGAQIATSMKAVQEAVNLVRASGYRCDSVLIMRKMTFKRGYTLICNQASYEYDIVDRGGNWDVEYVD